MDDRDIAKYYAAGRVGIGLILFVFPGRSLRGMLGGSEHVTPGAKLLARLVGARDAILGAGTLAALQDGEDASLRPWMTYGAVADASDAVAFVLAYRHLPKRKRFLMVTTALGGASTGGYLITKFD
jgi:hypothetical protein